MIVDSSYKGDAVIGFGTGVVERDEARVLDERVPAFGD